MSDRGLPSSPHALTPLALTMGDPAGIGPDITLAAWAARGATTPPFVCVGDLDCLRQRANALGLTVKITEVAGTSEATSRFATALPVIPIKLAENAAPGRPSPKNALAVLASIDAAVTMVMQGEARAVVTNPISKAVLQQSGFAHPGHTEYLAALAAGPGGKPPFPVMMLASGSLRVVPVTIHIPLHEVPGALTPERLRRTLRITASELTDRFGISAPRMAVTGLNPHAGESGHMGREEITIIAPVIKELRAAGLDISGPHPADAIFQERQRRNYDAIVAMYHDQALIPIKALAFDTAVNITLGLPFVRTSPDHGTAFDIAGTGKASPSSLISALATADSLSARGHVA